MVGEGRLFWHSVKSTEIYFSQDDFGVFLFLYELLQSIHSSIYGVVRITFIAPKLCAEQKNKQHLVRR